MCDGRNDLASPHDTPTHPTPLHRVARLTSIADNGDVNTLQESILAYNASILNFGVFLLIAKVMATVSGVFTLVQGSATWDAELRNKKTNALPTAISAATELISTLDSLDQEGVTTAYVNEVVDESKAYRAMMRERLIDYGELLPAGEEEFDAQGVKDFDEMPNKLGAALKKAVGAMKTCEGKVRS